MGLFDKFKKRKMPSDKEIAKSVEASKELWDTNIRDIWDIANINQFLIAMNGWICKKCDYGSNLDALSDQEQIIYFTIQFEAEVNNGGFSQYFFNAYGDISANLVASFEAISAEKTAGICKKAISALGENMPSDRMQREEFLDKVLTDEVEEILSNCDNEFYNQTYDIENLEQLNYQFIMKNKVYFT